MRRLITFVALFVGLLTAFGSEKDVVVDNPRASVRLAGTLATPDGELAPRAVFVFATGSGAQNRDEEVFGLRPFKVLSDSLTNAGYAVLRMDDRGVGDSSGDYDSALTDDFADDVRAGIDYARAQFPDVPVGILGHSMGGTVAIKLAAANVPDFIVTMAAPAWSGDSLIMAQCRALAVATVGKWDGEQLERRLLDVAKSTMSDAIALPVLYQMLAETAGVQAASIPEVQQKLLASARSLLSPWYRDMLRYDPADDIRAVKIPWLALNGTKDTQVPVENLLTITELCPAAKAIAVSGHNHLFQPAKSGLPNEYPTQGQAPSTETISILLTNIPVVTK